MPAFASTICCSRRRRRRGWRRPGVDKEVRGREGASDHAPAWVELGNEETQAMRDRDPRDRRAAGAACSGASAATTRCSARCSARNYDYTTYEVREGKLPSAPEEQDGYIVTGSPAGVYDDLPWIEPLKTFLVQAKGKAKLVGICFGHQIMAEAFGGRVEKSDRGWGIGLHRYQISERGRVDGRGVLVRGPGLASGPGRCAAAVGASPGR